MDFLVLEYKNITKTGLNKRRLSSFLYYMKKYTDREIGKILNMKENTVRTKRNRIKNKIKKFYEEYWRI